MYNYLYKVLKAVNNSKFSFKRANTLNFRFKIIYLVEVWVLYMAYLFWNLISWVVFGYLYYPYHIPFLATIVFVQDVLYVIYFYFLMYLWLVYIHFMFTDCDLKKFRNVLSTFIHLMRTYCVSIRTVNFDSIKLYKFLFIFCILIILYI